MMVMAVGNNRFAGGGFEVAPKANLQDGLLDLAVLSADTLPPLGAIGTQLEDPTSRVNKFLPYRQGSYFTIESNRPLHMNLDGGPMVDQYFKFKVHPGALKVVPGNLPQ